MDKQDKCWLSAYYCEQTQNVFPIQKQYRKKHF